MSDMLDPQQLDNAASILSQFKQKVSQIIGEMQQAASTCQSEMQGDPVASGAASELSQALAKIEEELAQVDKLIADLGDEKGDAQQISVWD